MTIVVPPAAFGVSGNSSLQMLDRIGSFALDDLQVVSATPDVALIYGMPNDLASGLTQAQTQLYTQCMLLAIKHGAYGFPYLSGGAHVATVSALPANGNVGQRCVVRSDTDTSGGVSWAAVGSSAATITGAVANSGPAVWEFVCRLAGVLGWRRVAVSSTAPTACKRIVVIGTNYKNYSNNGSDSTAAGAAGKRDTLATPEPYYAAVRTAMSAAVTAENVTVAGKPSVVYADLYALQRTLIAGGTYPSSGSPTYSITASAGDIPDYSGGTAYVAGRDWHYASSNQHHGDFGHETVAVAAYLSIMNTWKSDLQKLSYVNMKAIGDSQTNLMGGYAAAPRTWVPTLGRMLQAGLS